MLGRRGAEAREAEIRIERERAEDADEVEALLDLCFAPGRTALSSYRLREGVAPVAELCLVLRHAGMIAAAIRHWPVRVGCAPALLVGPVAVHPTHQGEGLGGLLIGAAIERAAPWRRMLLVGDAPYYGRFGFVRLERVAMPPPTNPERVLGLALEPGAWDGVEGEVRRWDACLAPAAAPSSSA